MISEVFVSAETIALAKEKACKMLGVTEDKVEFEIRQFPSKKVLGMFGGKSAQIKAALKKSEAEKAVEFLKEIFFYMGLENLNVEKRMLCPSWGRCARLKKQNADSPPAIRVKLLGTSE